MAVAGVYGANPVRGARRTSEIGIPIALCAGSTEVQYRILRGGAKLTLTGLGLGLIFAAGAAKLLSSRLYEVSAFDPLVFVISPLLLATAALLACWIPARRAAKVDPMVALRTE